jgi:hypothetical protein
MKLLISGLKIATMVLLAGSAITILAFLLDIIDTTIIFAFFGLFEEITIPFDIFLNYPNFWIVLGYFLFKGAVVLGIDTVKARLSNG